MNKTSNNGELKNRSASLRLNVIEQLRESFRCLHSKSNNTYVKSTCFVLEQSS